LTFEHLLDDLHCERHANRGCDRADLRQVQGAPLDFTDLKAIVAGPNLSLHKYDSAVRKVEETLKDTEGRKKIRLLLPSLFGRIVCYTQAGGHDNGAFEVLDRQGKVVYSSLDKVELEEFKVKPLKKAA